MQISISGRHGHLSAETQNAIEEKVEKLSKYHDHISHATIMVDLEHRDEPRVEVCIKVEHADEFVACDKASELFIALDSVLKKVEQQLRKHKEKITNHKIGNGNRREPE